MIEIRKAEDRGKTQWGWLESYHSFSFGDYHDPSHHRFRSLRVINDDKIAPGKGFGEHPHRDMEIVSYVVSGSLEHKDSMGNGSIITAGEVQRMSAGTGITHSEFNPSATEPTHLLQIWFFPEEKGLEPSYEQKAFSVLDNPGRWHLLASQDGRDGSVHIHQNASLYGIALDAGQSITGPTLKDHFVWLQVIVGDLNINGQIIKTGDGVKIEHEPTLHLKANQSSHVLLFELE